MATISIKRNIIYLCLIIAGLIIVFIVFNKKQFKSKKTLPVCTRLQKVKIRGRQPALAPNYKLQWSNNIVLMVYFHEDIGAIADKIIEIANTWAKYAAISFRKTDKITKSQIRVTIKSGGYSSAVGLECKQEEYTNEPTTFLEGLDSLQDMKEFNRVVLHEFGHVIGLEHELRKSSAKIPWDTPAVYKYYADHYKWDTSEVHRNIFMQFDVPKEYEEFDSTSIMLYAVPNVLTKGDFSIPWPEGLSISDAYFIKKWYPKF